MEACLRIDFIGNEGCDMIHNGLEVNVGLLIIRLVVGLTFMGHGTQKLFGWFGGAGPQNTGKWLESLGIQSRGTFFAVAAGLFELVGGLLFAAGFMTLIGSTLIVIVMIDAIIAVHGPNGYWMDRGGFEYNLVLIAVVIGIALVGPGQFTYPFSI